MSMTTFSQTFERTATRGIGYVNHGRWLVDCPTCGGPVLFDPGSTDKIVCGSCTPQIFAVYFVQRRTPTGRIVFDPQPDPETRQTARQNAPAISPIIPNNVAKIMDALRVRPLDKMNWLPGETVDQLVAQNLENGIGRVT